MRKESLLTFGIGFFLLISVAYATLLNYYGRIIGTTDVQPPTFYADFTAMSTGWKRLNVNTPPALTGNLTISGGNDFVFHTNALSITSFYAANWTFFVRAKVNSPPKSLKLELWRIDPAVGSLIPNNKICEGTVSITSTEYSTYSTTCTAGLFTLSPSGALGYRIKGVAGIYNIDVDNVGTTRIEVSP